MSRRGDAARSSAANQQVNISETKAVNDWSQHAAYDLFIKLQGLAIVVKLITVWVADRPSRRRPLSPRLEYEGAPAMTFIDQQHQ